MIKIKDPNNADHGPGDKDVKPLTPKEIDASLSALEDWRYVPEKASIRAEYKMRNFMSAAYFIQEVAKLAEAMNHHPDVHLTGNKYLAFDLTTQSVNGVTANDLTLAREISEKFVEFSTPVQDIARFWTGILNYETSRTSAPARNRLKRHRLDQRPPIED